MRFVRFITAAGLTFAAACGSSTGPGGGGNPNGITIQDFSFSPNALTVKVGTTVTWTNNGPSTHTTTSDAGDAQMWNSGNLGPPSGGGGYGGGTPGGTYSVTFMAAGTYTYHCNLHPPSMYPSFTGKITVTP
jgi:plastocyanin